MFESALLGLLVSGLTEASKRLGWSVGWVNTAVALALSVIAAVLFQFTPNFWESLVGVFAVSQTFYSVVTKNLPK